MIFSGCEVIYLFILYGFIGWILETIFAVLQQKRFVNRGLINGPICIIYSISAALMSLGLHELDGIWLFLSAFVYATVIEWVAGQLIEKHVAKDGGIIRI